MKSDNTKIQELINIRKQIQQLGFLTIQENSKKLSMHSNAFLKENIPSTFKLYIPSQKITAIIILSNHKQSGITLEK